MKSYFILLNFCLLLTSCSNNSSDYFISESSDKNVVYICKGAYSKSYHHNKDCEGLRTCTTTIYKTTIDLAQKKSRTLCGYEK